MSVISALANFSAHLLPHTCFFCGNQGEAPLDLCQDCIDAFPKLISPCLRCALPLPPNYHEQVCGQCLKTPKIYDRVIIPFAYQTPVDRLLMGLKFGERLIAAKIFGVLLAKHIQALVKHQHYQLPECIIPVPLHTKRLRERGFNQALEIAKPLSKLLNIPIITDALSRKKATSPQSQLPARARANNVADAFGLNKKLHYQRVAVLDDIMTTGQTTRALGKVLLQQAGIEHLEAWCVARALIYAK